MPSLVMEISRWTACRGWKRIRVSKVKSSRLIQLDVSQSAATLYIYRVGWSYPLGVKTLTNPVSKYNSELGLAFLDRSNWFMDWSNRHEPVWPVRSGCRSSGRHNLLIRSPNWTFYIWISMRSTQWWSPIDNFTKLPWPIRPVYTTSRIGSPSLSSTCDNSGCQQRPIKFVDLRVQLSK